MNRNKFLASRSVIALIAVNILPILGVIFFDWDLLEIIFLYWLETGIIGLYSMMKIIIVTRLKSLVYVPFLTLHLGAFMGVHLMFIFLFFGAPESYSLSEIGQRILGLIQINYISIIFIFLSHGLSFYENFYKSSEYRRSKFADLMSEPYRRVVLMHVTLVIGGGIMKIFNIPSLGLIFLITLKIVVDIISHKLAHNRYNKPETIVSWATSRAWTGDLRFTIPSLYQLS